jgi:hypothetical protein
MDLEQYLVAGSTFGLQGGDFLDQLVQYSIIYIYIYIYIYTYIHTHTHKLRRKVAVNFAFKDERAGSINYN